MRKSLKNIEQGSNQIHKIVHLSYQLCLTSFKSVLQGIIKRVECQALCKIIVHSSPYNKTTHKLKLMQYIAQRSLKDKKQQVFNRIRKSGQDQKIRIKTAKSLALTLKRIAKEKFNDVFVKLKGKEIEPYSRIQDNKKSRQSIKSGRLSEQSHILSVSQSSLLSSRLLHFEQSKQYSRQEIIHFRIENEQLKRMALSEELRQSLLIMQRFDRYIYNTESQKILKEPITEQLRRLEKMKNEHREMRSKYYDNQLTVTCLYNHVKLVSQMNRQIGDINALKAKITELDKKLADASALHRKEISQYKKKLLFLDSGSKSKNQQKETINDSRTSIEEISSSSQLNSDELTTYNILITALKGKSYVDVRREIDHFLKISAKEKFTILFKELENLINDMQLTEKQKISAEKSRADILNSLNLFDRYLREQKFQEMEKLKNKCNVQSPMELTELFQTVLAAFQQIKKMRKKQAVSNEKPKKGFQKEYEDQKIEIKQLQARIKQLEDGKQKLTENLKKFCLSLPPRRKSNDKEAQLSSKPNSQNDSKLQKEIQKLTKQKQLIIKSNQIAQETANKQYSQLQEELNRSRSKLKQFEDGFKYSSLIRQKKDSKQPFTREINQFKRLYPSSIFTDYFIRIQNQQSTKLSIATQIKGIITFFNEGNWRKRTNFQIKIDGEVFTLLNSIIQMLYNLHQKQEEYNKDVDDWKTRYSSIEAQKITLDEQMKALKQENIARQQQLKALKEQNERIFKQNNQLQTTIASYQQSLSKFEKQANQSNPNTPSKASNHDDENWQELLKENEMLRFKLEQLQNKAAQSPINYRSPIMQLSESKSSVSKNHQAIEKAKELQDFLKYYQQIKRKKLTKLDYRKELQELKMDYPDSHLVQILQNNLGMENHHATLANQKEEAFNYQINNMKAQLDQQQRTLNEKIEQLTVKLQEANQQEQENRAKIKQLEDLLQQSNKIIEQNKDQLGTKNIEYQQLCFELAQSKTQIEFLSELLDKSNAELILIKRREKSLSPLKEESKGEKSNSNSAEKNEVYRNKLAPWQEKLANYKLLFEKLKGQRDNLNLLLEQKNEQYENCKENLQKLEESYRSNQVKIEQLQRSICMTENQFKRLEKEAEQLVLDRDALFLERKTQQSHFNAIIKSKEDEIQRMKLFCEDKDRRCVSLHYEIQQSRRKNELDMAHLHQQRNYLYKNLEAAEQEINRIRIIHEEEIQQYRKKYERSNIEMNYYRENVELERQLLRQKVTEFTRITESATSNQLLQDHQKVQLRRQLDLLNSQLANIIRNNQNELRESRRYIEQLINEVQSKEVLHNEQRKILKQSIQRARNEQYEINQQKIRQLRQDIQALRQQNERLISIIDSNEAPFNKLLQEHKDLHQGILELQESNNNLQQENAMLRQENIDLAQRLKGEQAQKQELSNELEMLQQKMSSFEMRIVAAINEGQLKEEIALKEHKEKIGYLEQRMTHLKEQNSCFNVKNISQAQEIMKLHSQLIRLQMELNRQRSSLERSHHQNIQSKNSEYSKYLQEKLNLKETEVKKSQEKESQMLKKIEELMRVLHEMQGEKQHLLSCLQHQQMNFNSNLTNCQKDIAFLQEKIKQQQGIINAKNEEAMQNSFSSNHSQRISELETIISEREAERSHLLLQNNRLSHTVNEENHRRITLQHRLSQYQKLVLENKRLTNKLIILEEDAKQFKHSLSQYSTQITFLQGQFQQAKPSLQLNQMPIFSVEKILSEEIQWLKKQLDLRNQDISKLNNKNAQLSAEIDRIDGIAAQVQQNQNRYNRESQLLEQAKGKIRRLQLTISNYAYSKQKAEESFTYQTIQKDREICLLNETVQDLRKKYETTTNKFINQTKEQNHFLLQIARKLDQNYQITDQQQKIEISILKKISRQIGELIQMNNLYKQKCEFMERQGYQLRIDEAQCKTVSSLRFMYLQLLSYLKSNEIINPEQSTSLPQGIDADKVIIDMGFLLRELFNSFLRTNQEEITRYNSIIRDIRAMIDEAYLTRNLQALNRLRKLLTQAQQK